MAWEFYKDRKTDKVWQVNEYEIVDGEYFQCESGPYFSFDKENVFSIFADYPHNLTEEQIKLFDIENPYWADFMNDSKKEHDFEYVQAFISNISFPTNVEGLRFFIYEHGSFNVEDILCDLNSPQNWTVPRHSKVGDIVLFFHAKTAYQRIVALKNKVNKNFSEYDDAELLLKKLNYALELAKEYGGKIIAIGRVTSVPSFEDYEGFEGQHWGNRIYADIDNIQVLKNPVDISEFNDFILISRQSAITRLPHEEYVKLREIITAKNNNLPTYYLNSKIGDFTLSHITKDNFLEETKLYRRRFLLEIDFRSYFVDYLLRNISGSKFYRECACYREKAPISFVDNVFMYNGKYYLLEVKLNINLEIDLKAQLKKYIRSDYVFLDNKHKKRLDLYERNFMFVIDTEAIYKYTYDDDAIEIISNIDDLRDIINPFDL